MNETIEVRTLVDRGEAEITTGPFGTQLKAAEYSHKGVPVINVRNVGFGNIREDKLEYLPDEAAERLRRHKLLANDIVFGRKGAVERHAFIRPAQAGWVQGSDCIRLRFFTDTVDPLFISYSFQTHEHQQWMISHGSVGATMHSLNQDIIGRIKLSLPPLPTQRKIAAILSAYDDLIENNARRVRVLEDMARALYREWFVEYRYPGHEHDEFVEDEHGRRPAGWERVRFTDVVLVLSGGTPKTTEVSFWGGGIPFYSPKDSPDSFYVTATEKTLTDEGLRRCNSRLYPKDTVFITARGTVGKLALAAGDMAMNQSCYALDSRAVFGQHFLFLMTERLVEALQKQATGAVFDAITVATFQKMHVLHPPADLLAAFSGKVQLLFDASLTLTRRNANLRRTRDLLLPRLVSGELDVSNLNIRGAAEGAAARAEAVA